MIIALALTVSVAAIAQPKAIGARLGSDFELSYQHYVNNADFLELNLGTNLFGLGINTTATYNFMIAQPNWTDRGQWGFYAGPGLSLGSYFVSNGDKVRAGFCTGIVGQVGLEYNFWFPLQLSFDLRPMIGFGVDSVNGVVYYTPGLFGFTPHLAVRYAF